ALPTIGSAVAYDLLKSWDRLDFSDAGLIVLGFVVAFLTALAVVRFLLDFVSRHGFEPLAWWRIAVGLAGLAGLAATGCLSGLRPPPAVRRTGRRGGSATDRTPRSPRCRSARCPVRPGPTPPRHPPLRSR